MKKKLALALSVTLMLGIAPLAVHAEEEVILTVNHATWTAPGTAVGLATSEWGEPGSDDPVKGVSLDNANISAGCNAENTYVTYSAGIPVGEYDVYYWICGNHAATSPLGRRMRVLDNDVLVTDKYGTKEIKSIKPSWYYEGYVNLGSYYFDGGNDSIKVTMNDEAFAARTQAHGTPLIASTKIKFVPADQHTDLLGAVNTSETVDDVRMAIENYGGEYMTADALVFMNRVYEEILAGKPYETAVQLKNQFDTSVESKTKTVEYASSMFAWQAPVDAINKFRVRNGMDITVSNSYPNMGKGLVTFDNISNEGIKSVELDLAATRTEFDIQLTKYSSDTYAASVGMDIYIEEANYTDFDDKVSIMPEGDKIDAEAIKTAVAQNGSVSLYLEPDRVDWIPAQVVSQYKTDAILRVTYDISDVGGDVPFAASFEDEIELSDGTPAKIEGNKVLKLKADKSFADIDFMDAADIKCNGEPVDFTYELLDGDTIAITFNDGLKYDSAYTITCDNKYVYFQDDEQRFTFNFTFSTEKYPIEFSGLTVKVDGDEVDTLSGANGKTVVAKGTVKNNSLEATEVTIMINIFENTDYGVKMVDSKIAKGSLSANDDIELITTPFKLGETGTYFITANIWNNLKSMTPVKMYNTASYQRFE